MALHPATQQGSPFGQQQQTPLYHSRAAQPFNLQHTHNQVQQIQHHQTMFPGHAGTKPIGNTSELLPGNALQATRRMHGEAAECGGLPERT